MLAHCPMQIVETSRLDELHGVVDGQAIRDVPAGRVDVEVDVLVWIGALEVQELCDDKVGDVIVDTAAQEDDSLVQQARVDVETALAARRLLDDYRYQGVGFGKHGLLLLDDLGWCAVQLRRIGLNGRIGSTRHSHLTCQTDTKPDSTPERTATRVWRES